MPRSWAPLATLARLRVTAVYAVALVVVSVWMSRLNPELQNTVIEQTSTNLHNLGSGRLDTLITSAFVADAGPEWEWAPGLIFLLAIGELLWGSARLVVALVLSHVGATLLVAAWLAVAVARGWLPVDVATEADVGMSYCVVGVLGALAPAIPRPWRLAWVGWWLGVALVVAFIETDFAYLGHLVAFLIGLIAATRFGAPRPFTPSRAVPLVLGSIFGYLVLTNEVPPVLPVAAGVAGAAIGAAVALVLAGRRLRVVDPGDPAPDVPGRP